MAVSSNKTSCGERHNKPRPCCHLANEMFMQTEDRQTYQPPWTKSAATKRVQTRCPIPLAVILITNKLPFDPPTRLPELTQNVIRSSHGHSTPSLKISCKSVQPFSRNVADKETKKERKKEIARNNTRPPIGGGVINLEIQQLKYHPFTLEVQVRIHQWQCIPGSEISQSGRSDLISCRRHIHQDV